MHHKRSAIYFYVVLNLILFGFLHKTHVKVTASGPQRPTVVKLGKPSQTKHLLGTHLKKKKSFLKESVFYKYIYFNLMNVMTNYSPHLA